MAGRDCILPKSSKMVPAEKSSSEGESSNSSTKSSPNFSLPVHYHSATSKPSSLPFLPQSQIMADAFNAWQFRFRQGQANEVPDSLAPHHIPNYNCDSQPQMSDADFDIAERDFRKFESQMQDPGFTPPSFNSQQTEPSAQFEQTPPASDVPSKKRPAKNQGRKGKQAKTTVILSDIDDADDGNQVQRWTDPEVIQLISFRSEMEDDFKNNAKKQGINTWEKLYRRMVASCDNFSKSPEACRKKWKAVYNQYCNDKRLLQISGEGRKVACKYFDEIDEGFNNAANVRKLCHGDARGNPNPCPPDLNDQWEAQESAYATSGGEPTSMAKEVSPTSAKSLKKSAGEHISSFLSDMAGHYADMVNCSRLMVTQTTRIADDIHSNGQVLKELQIHMAKLIDKL